MNWEANSILLGELEGPVRAIREMWGADSGTNVTKTETFYRDAVSYRYRVRVHPIPPDGLYTSWDYNQGVAVTYYNACKPEGVAIDGVNDDVAPTVDEIRSATPPFFDAPDPTFDTPVHGLENWEQVVGRRRHRFARLHARELRGRRPGQRRSSVPYYRDDACFDDGTGDNPVGPSVPGRDLDRPAGEGRLRGRRRQALRRARVHRQAGRVRQPRPALLRDPRLGQRLRPQADRRDRRPAVAVRGADRRPPTWEPPYGNTVIAPLPHPDGGHRGRERAGCGPEETDEPEGEEPIPEVSSHTHAFPRRARSQPIPCPRPRAQRRWAGAAAELPARSPITWSAPRAETSCSARPARTRCAGWALATP